LLVPIRRTADVGTTDRTLPRPPHLFGVIPIAKTKASGFPPEMQAQWRLIHPRRAGQGSRPDDPGRLAQTALAGIPRLESRLQALLSLPGAAAAAAESLTEERGTSPPSGDICVRETSVRQLGKRGNPRPTLGAGKKPQSGGGRRLQGFQGEEGGSLGFRSSMWLRPVPLRPVERPARSRRPSPRQRGG